MTEKTRKREIAYKISIESLKKYPYCQQEGWLPNYVEFQDNKISRVNIFGTVILKPISENVQHNIIVIDDGTDQIEIRTFEQDFNFDEFNVGDLINIIGRVRDFNNNRYVIPEIIKKIKDLKIIELIRKELRIEELKYLKNKVAKVNTKIVSSNKEEKIEEPKSLPIYEKIINEIRNLDKGNGADIQEVLINTNLINREELITELLQKGDIFEINPGKVKILE